jgi:8-oxo-dGTP pyrophosphatase MutT (NUDIX family)
MVRHTYVNGWFLPGGGVEHGEPTIEALRRELLEEAGVRLITDPPVVGIYSNHQNFRNDHVLLYRVPWGSWEQEKATSVGEIAETAWVDPLAPIKGATKGTLQRFDELYRGAAQSPYWVDPTR